MIFDGKKFAEETLRTLPRKKVKLVTIVDPENAAGMKYAELKRKMAERLGVEFEINTLNPKLETLDSLKTLIAELNNDPDVGGIMMQLPFAGSEELIKVIDPAKDVDGLKKDGPFRPAVVRAVVEILNSNIKTLNQATMVIVGNKGFVGQRLMQEFPGAAGMDKDDWDETKLKTAEVIISATGQAGLIGPELVKDGVVCIDLGYPKGDFTPEVAEKASFFTPVPGGVGPVTVAMLFANLLKS